MTLSAWESQTGCTDDRASRCSTNEQRCLHCIHTYLSREMMEIWGALATVTPVWGESDWCVSRARPPAIDGAHTIHQQLIPDFPRFCCLRRPLASSKSINARSYARLDTSSDATAVLSSLSYSLPVPSTLVHVTSKLGGHKSRPPAGSQTEHTQKLQCYAADGQSYFALITNCLRWSRMASLPMKGLSCGYFRRGVRTCPKI
ncbi:hypothetical protein FPOA_02738 [Fusarium poae]|uniref:Uncharacterized protein n=1 Tax=Fusarium poae TaxID=36050 RepID=A0A1B8B7V2_FUSPO|nr:hypothetical protein FPOA_02738 [Fusarium poae]